MFGAINQKLVNQQLVNKRATNQQRAVQQLINKKIGLLFFYLYYLLVPNNFKPTRKEKLKRRKKLNRK
jgi:hypothetical protein